MGTKEGAASAPTIGLSTDTQVGTQSSTCVRGLTCAPRGLSQCPGHPSLASYIGEDCPLPSRARAHSWRKTRGSINGSHSLVLHLSEVGT